MRLDSVTHSLSQGVYGVLIRSLGCPRVDRGHGLVMVDAYSAIGTWWHMGPSQCNIMIAKPWQLYSSDR